MTGTADTRATAALASQSSDAHGCSKSWMPSGSRAAANRHPASRENPSVRVEANLGAAVEQGLDPQDSFEVRVHVEADLHLEGAESPGEQCFQFVGQGFGLMGVDRIEERYAGGFRDIEQGVAGQHVERREQRRCRGRIVSDAGFEQRPSVVRVPADETRGHVAAKAQSPVEGLVGVALRDHRLAETVPAVVVPNLDDNRLEVVEHHP